MEVKITNEYFESLKNGELPLVVDFWATWCGPCKAIAPLVEELAKEYDGKIVVGKCDVEENDDIAMEFGIRNSEPLKNAALKNAISDARSKAEVIADSLGVKIIGIKSVSESVINIHNRDYANSVMNMSMKETSIAPGTMEFNANVVIEFVIK